MQMALPGAGAVRHLPIRIVYRQTAPVFGHRKKRRRYVDLDLSRSGQVHDDGRVDGGGELTRLPAVGGAVQQVQSGRRAPAVAAQEDTDSRFIDRSFVNANLAGDLVED